MSMRAAAGLKDLLGETLEKSSEVVMDAASVERMSTASIQILLAYFDAARQLSISVSVQSPSVAFVDAFNDLGLAASISNRQIEA
jgi:anti-anti-sigma regulatory factor